MNIAIIPARGGSKRIPRKNIREFCGKPMIAWSIDAAWRSECFDHVIVSTDDDEIAEISRVCGAEVPFIRPADLSDDHTPTIPVIAHALRWLARHGTVAELACCIYATAPLIQPKDIERGLETLKQSGAEYAFSVTTFASPIQRAIRITDENRIEMFNPEHFETRSQDLEEAYHDAGQFYWGRCDAWLKHKALFTCESAPVKVERERVQDIDSLEDWKQAESLFRIVMESNQ